MKAVNSKPTLSEQFVSSREFAAPYCCAYWNNIGWVRAREAGLGTFWSALFSGFLRYEELFEKWCKSTADLAKNSKKPCILFVLKIGLWIFLRLKSDFKYWKRRLVFRLWLKFLGKSPRKCIFPNVLKLKITASPAARRPCSILKVFTIWSSYK